MSTPLDPDADGGYEDTRCKGRDTHRNSECERRERVRERGKKTGEREGERGRDRERKLGEGERERELGEGERRREVYRDRVTINKKPDNITS